MASRPAGKRLPISCQACRTRKIRCSRDGRPCQTCVRRGLGAEDCIYLGQPRLSAENTTAADAAVQNELLARIRNLEDLLHKQVGSQIGDPLSPQTSPSATTGSASESDGTVLAASDFRSNPLPSCVGTLQSFAAGYVRYQPLASQWNSPLLSGGSIVNNSNSLPDISSEVPEEDDDLQIPLGRNAISREELLAILPPGRYCDALKDVYFRVFSPLFHILHDLTFEAEYQQFCHDPSSVSTSWVALLFTILSIAVIALDDDDPLLLDLGREKTVSRNVKALSSRYRSAALRCLAADGIVSRHSINSFQSLVLLNYARMQRGLTSWTLTGFTHHVAISMGCHIDPERFALGAIEREERRRAWAGLTMLYTLQNHSFGITVPCMLSQDVKPPLDINDVDLLTSSSEPSGGPTQMTYLLLEARLTKIAGMIREALFSFPVRFSFAQIESEILAVRETCDKRYHLDNGSLEPLPTTHQANLNILYSDIHQLFLLLLRPGLCRYLQGEITPETCAARAKCVTSAKASLAIYQSLYDTPQFAAYKWYNSGTGSFHAFHAAIVLSVILLYPDNQYEFTEIKDLLWNSLDVFAALSNRSNFCSKAVPVLRNIIDMACSRSQQTLIAMDASSVGGMISPTGSSTPGSGPAPTPAPYTTSYPSPTVEYACEELFLLLHPQHWMNATCVPWDGWEFLAQEQQKHAMRSGLG
ncbi:C6 zinc finger domain protein [Aspergillus ambiguus]|uniref:Zn(II)2Cys6 transcription factor n=1 Tax=Aspergillus ambiguus TaxID=176160 RepID=UPI003CCCABE1